MTYCNIDDDILRASDVDLNLFRARRVNGRSMMAITTVFFCCSIPNRAGHFSWSTFQSNLYLLVRPFIHSDDAFIRPILRSPFSAKRSFRFSRLKRDDSVNLLDLGRPRQRRFMDRERYLRVPIPRVEIYLRPPRRNYEQQAKVPTVTILLLFSSSSLSFSFSSIFFFSILFGPLSIIVMKVHRNVLSNMRRAISRVCRETHGVENSRKCSCHRKCERYSFTKLIISLRWKGRRRKGEILGWAKLN